MNKEKDDIIIPQEGKEENIEDEAKIVANIPHVFEIETSNDVVKLPLYPQSPGYMVLITEKLFGIANKVMSLQSDKLWKKLKKFTEKSNEEKMKRELLRWCESSIDEACGIFQLLFETGSFTGEFTVLSEELFKWYFTVPLMEEILEVFLRQNDITRVVKKVLQFAQGQPVPGAGLP